ncbi:DMT family transporter [Brockia lithotrophica]|uniref:Drug/metabolite transporter (DMT)-like permease n=1 Tax=Brockia lithotrophica TaxID=933949 RepID=A0A660KVC6_9BACL|nr:DMT family transporter [Brockia lithotrophica]RKQ84124.1 drug/metabolite transporter (DMT)-like permease [Brockia lithotrophica]
MNEHLRGAFAVVLAASLYGALSPLVRLSYEGGATFADVTLAQLGVGALFLWVFGPRRYPWQVPGGIRAVVPYVLLGIVGVAGVTLLYTSALRWIPASQGLILLFQYLWIGLLLDVAFGKARWDLRKLAAAASVLGGAAIALEVWNFRPESGQLMGVVLGLFSALGYAVFLFGLSRRGDFVDVWTRGRVLITTGFLTALPILLVFFPEEVFATPLDVRNVTLLLFQGVAGQVFPPLLMAYGAPRVGATLTTLLSATELPAGTLLAIVLVGEPVGTCGWVGVAMILLGVFFSVWESAALPNASLIEDGGTGSEGKE